MFPQIFGKYVLERELAAGGMARVFLATLRGAVGFEKRLVVKQIRAELAVDEAFVRRFVEEAKTAVELSHPNIVPVYELGVEQGVYYIAMEYCSGVTLSEVLARTGQLDPEEGAYVGAEVCRAIDYAYRRAGIVHRDVTPRNVLLDDEGGVRLIDFGIAAPAEASGGRREVFGSPGHMPPEQLRGDALGPATDVFAIGTVLIEAWTGKPPFRRSTPHDSALALRETPPFVDQSVPALAPVAELVASSVAFDVEKRPADAEQLGRGLRDFLRVADSVEVSRRLAARVRRARPDALDTVTPTTAPADGTARVAGTDTGAASLETPANMTPTTATFAAREEMVEWTRKLSSIPPPLAAPDGTRRLSTAPSPRAVKSPRSRAGIGAVVVAGLGAAGFAVLFLGPAAKRSAPPEPPAARAVTQPPVVAGSMASSAASAPPNAANTDAAPVLAVVAPAPVHAEAAPSHAAHSVTSAPSAPARAGTPSVTTTSLPATPPASAPSPAADSAREPPSPAANRVADGTLRLTADPQAVVSVSGNGFSQTSATPVRSLAVPPGRYRVVFRSETYGAPVATEVTLAAGATRSVHADFRAAEPSVTVR